MFPIHDPVLIFAVVMLLVLVAPLVFERLRVPGIIGLIVAGIAIGPHALGILERDRTMELLGAVGLLYIMFMAGLEIDLNQFARQRSHSVVFGVLTFIIPMAAGIFAGVSILGLGLPSAILLASMFSSHTLVTYPIASRLGLTKVRAVTTTIGGTIITDTAALMVLAIIAGSVGDVVGPWFWFRMLLLMAFYVAAVALLLPRIGRWFFRHMEADGATEYVFVLASVFLCAWLAHVAGLEPIMGAFLAGLSLNRLIPERSALMNRIHFVGNALFIPFFLITVGMLINLRLLGSGLTVWKVSATMIACAVLAKWGASAVTRRVLKYDRSEGLLIFGLSVNQAAATLAAVLVGYDLGLFNDAILTGTIVMIMGTCIVGPWVTESAARELALKETQKPYNPANAPHRIMVPLTNPESASTLMDLACLLREKGSTEPVYPLTVIVDGPDAEAAVAAGERLLGNAVAHAVSVNVPVVPVTRIDIHPETGILGAMRDYRISVVIAGWNGERSSRQHVFGRVLDPLLEETRQMVIVGKMGAALNTAQRVVLLIPPMVERHVGFQIGMRAVKVLAGQIGVRLCVVSEPGVRGRIASVIDGIRPVVQTDAISIGSWNALPAWLSGHLKDGDVTVLARVRKGRLAWQPSLDRLPGDFVRTFPSRDLLTVYLPESRLGGEYELAEHVEDPSIPALFPPGGIQVHLDGVQLGDAIRLLLKESFGARPDVYEPLVRRLVSVGYDAPVELAPGAVLIHTHSWGAVAPSIHVGINRTGFSLPHVSQPPRILVLLISPRDRSSEQHLQLLAMIARWMHKEAVFQSMCRVGGREEMLKILSA